MRDVLADLPTMETALWGSGRVADIYAAFEAVDLSKIRGTLGRYEGHSDDFLHALEIEYRRYFALVTAYPDQKVVPSKIVDSFWHTHILDTRAYWADCIKTVGRFVHHNPYLGASEDERAELKDHFHRTQDLYRAHFGELSPKFWSRKLNADCSTESECGGSGGSGEGGCTSRCTGDDD